ncbi:MAG TPA: hypothetical protein VF034_14185 [Gemmatimonadaceae bacterium]
MISTAPTISILPAVGARSPRMHWARVVFPEPGAPTIATCSPDSTLSVNPRSTHARAEQPRTPAL